MKGTEKGSGFLGKGEKNVQSSELKWEWDILRELRRVWQSWNHSSSKRWEMNTGLICHKLTMTQRMDQKFLARETETNQETMQSLNVSDTEDEAKQIPDIFRSQHQPVQSLTEYG